MDIQRALRAVLDDTSDTDWNLSEDDSETEDNLPVEEQLDPLDIVQAGEESNTCPSLCPTTPILGSEEGPIINNCIQPGGEVMQVSLPADMQQSPLSDN